MFTKRSLLSNPKIPNMHLTLEHVMVAQMGVILWVVVQYTGKFYVIIIWYSIVDNIIDICNRLSNLCSFIALFVVLTFQVFSLVIDWVILNRTSTCYQSSCISIRRGSRLSYLCVTISYILPTR